MGKILKFRVKKSKKQLEDEAIKEQAIQIAKGIKGTFTEAELEQIKKELEEAANDSDADGD